MRFGRGGGLGSRNHFFSRAVLTVLLTGVLLTCRDTLPPKPAQEGATLQPSAAPAPPATLVGAGIIASCSTTGDEATAAILDTVPGTVFTTGDNVYPSGSLANFQTCYTPSWGRHKARTAPALGNHEYDTSPTAADYFTYFGAAAGDPTKGYYSYTLGTWHVVVLNSLISMSAGSPQEQWLRADLAANPQQCTLAYWHHPRFSSGTTHGSTPATQPLWQALYDAHADVVLAGHEHNYERFAPQTPTGGADPVNGIREFVVGTGGGAGGYPFGTPLANSEVRLTGTNGVLRLTLGAGTYAWQFIPVAGKTATDAGTGSCH
jgi:acid phosphatase type 7